MSTAPMLIYYAAIEDPLCRSLFERTALCPPQRSAAPMRLFFPFSPTLPNLLSGSLFCSFTGGKVVGGAISSPLLVQ